MKLIDMLAGTPSNDPKDESSGVKISVEPSVGLLEIVDAFAKEHGTTREVTLLAYAAHGALSKKAIVGFFGALLGGAADLSEDDFAARKAELDAKQLVLAKALVKKEALEEAAKACDEIAVKFQGQVMATSGEALIVIRQGEIVANACGKAVRSLKQRIVEEAERTT